MTIFLKQKMCILKYIFIDEQVNGFIWEVGGKCNTYPPPISVCNSKFENNSES